MGDQWSLTIDHDIVFRVKHFYALVIFNSISGMQIQTYRITENAHLPRFEKSDHKYDVGFTKLKIYSHL